MVYVPGLRLMVSVAAVIPFRELNIARSRDAITPMPRCSNTSWPWKACVSALKPHSPEKPVPKVVDTRKNLLL